MFTAALFIIPQKWKQVNVHEWTNKIWNTHTTEYYLVTKRNEVQIHATT